MSKRGDNMSGVVLVVSVLLFSVCWFFVLKKQITTRCASIKTVEAEVVDKYCIQTASKLRGMFGRETCMVVFATETEKLSFSVSELSYGEYHIFDKGKLTYQGNKIISFR